MIGYGASLVGMSEISTMNFVLQANHLSQLFGRSVDFKHSFLLGGMILAPLSRNRVKRPNGAISRSYEYNLSLVIFDDLTGQNNTIQILR